MFETLRYRCRIRDIRCRIRDLRYYFEVLARLAAHTRLSGWLFTCMEESIACQEMFVHGGDMFA